MRKKPVKQIPKGQALRIERVKAAAKALLGSVGAEKMTMRDLAKASGVSHPTLYNLFGTKDNIISIAVLDNYEQRVSRAIDSVPAGKSPLDKVHFSIRAVDREIRRSPAFAQAMMSAYFRIGNDRTMPDALYQTICDTWMPILQEMKDAQALQRWVSLPLLCISLSDQMFSITMKWTMRKIPRGQLADQISFAVFSILLGVSSSGQARAIQEVLVDLTVELEPGRAKADAVSQPA